MQFVEDAAVDVVLQKSFECRARDGSRRRMIHLETGPHEARPQSVEVKRAFPKAAGPGLGSRSRSTPYFRDGGFVGSQPLSGLELGPPDQGMNRYGIHAAQARPKPTCSFIRMSCGVFCRHMSQLL